MIPIRCIVFIYLIAFSGASRAQAHASEQGFVLLLPTDLYTGAGVVAVVLTLVLLGAFPHRQFAGRITLRGVRVPRCAGLQAAGSLAALILLVIVICVGLWGPRDPLGNALPLLVWTVFWIGIISLQGLLGDVWRLVNPMFAVGWVLRDCLKAKPIAHLSSRVGKWPAFVGFLIFASILLADPAPSDPGHLARLVGGYLVFQTGMLAVFGRRWLVVGEVFTVLMRLYSRVGLFAVQNRRLCFGFPGWQITSWKVVPTSTAILCVVLLGSGSFDGLNETFWWLSWLGINPLEFPGRSAVVWQNLIGLVVANLLLVAVFGACLWVGVRFLPIRPQMSDVFCRFAPTLLPIALGYHIAHYLPSFMVDSQYALVALSDPLMSGSDILGLGEFYVSTGFFNSQESVRKIYLAQAAAVVFGHIFAVLAAHSVARQMFETRRAVLISQAPLAGFMLLYTWFGLWLLASPRF